MNERIIHHAELAELALRCNKFKIGQRSQWREWESERERGGREGEREEVIWNTMKRYNKKCEYNGSRRQESVMPRPRGRIWKRIAPWMYKSHRCRFFRNVRHRHKTEPVPVLMLLNALVCMTVLICIISLFLHPSWSFSSSLFPSLPLLFFLSLSLSLSLALSFSLFSSFSSYSFLFLSHLLTRFTNGPAILSV